MRVILHESTMHLLPETEMDHSLIERVNSRDGYYHWIEDPTTYMESLDPIYAVCKAHCQKTFSDFDRLYRLDMDNYYDSVVTMNIYRAEEETLEARWVSEYPFPDPGPYKVEIELNEGIGPVILTSDNRTVLGPYFEPLKFQILRFVTHLDDEGFRFREYIEGEGTLEVGCVFCTLRLEMKHCTEETPYFHLKVASTAHERLEFLRKQTQLLHGN